MQYILFDILWQLLTTLKLLDMISASSLNRLSTVPEQKKCNITIHQFDRKWMGGNPQVMDLKINLFFGGNNHLTLPGRLHSFDDSKPIISGFCCGKTTLHIFTWILPSFFPNTTMFKFQHPLWTKYLHLPQRAPIKHRDTVVPRVGGVRREYPRHSSRPWCDPPTSSNNDHQDYSKVFLQNV